ncbi:MAG: hypothetical protein AB2A00_20240 [Myxococcota bacterium]
MNAFTVQVPGKLILCGEYAVLQGAPAVVAAVARHATCRVEPSPDGLKVSALGQGPLAVGLHDGKVTFTPAPADEARFVLTRSVLEERAARGLPSGVTLTLDSSALNEAALSGGQSVKLGLGSSSAAAVALTAALDLAGGATLSAEQRRKWFEAAQRAHLRAQGGVGSGVDVAASVMGGVIVYTRPTANPADAIIQPVKYEKLGVRLVVAWTGSAASTVELVGKVDAWRQRESAAAARRFQEMEELAKDAAHAAETGNRRDFLYAVNGYGAQLELLGKESGADILSAPHRRIRELAARHECGAKPSGAGGGDVAVCFCPDGWTAEALSRELQEAGFPTVPLEFDQEGVFVRR